MSENTSQPEDGIKSDIPPKPTLEKPTFTNKPTWETLQTRRSIMADDGEMPITIYEQLQQAKKISARTGQRIRKVFNKKTFIQQFPAAGSDPRMAFTPDTFIFDITPLESLTVGELRDMCLACKGHPLSFQKAMQVEGLADTVIVSVLKEELQILRQAAK